MPQPTPLWRRALYGLLTTVAFLLLAELVARQVEPRLPQQTPLPSPRGGSCLTCVPGAVRPDRDGAHKPIRLDWSEETGTWVALPPDAPLEGGPMELRGMAPAADKAPGELRILALGDSSMWGDGVSEEEVLSVVAAKRLTKALDRPVNAYIGAQPGHSSLQSLQVLRSMGRKVQPDVVLVGNLWSDLFHQSSPAFLKAPGKDAPSALYRLTLRLLSPWLEPETVSWIDPDRGVGMPGPGLKPRVEQEQYERNLRSIVTEARQLDARVAFVLLPAPIDLTRQGTPEFITAYRQSMRRVASEMNAPLVDGVEAFLERDIGNDHFFDSVHPSVAGHALLGELVAETLQPMLRSAPPSAGD